MLVPYGLAEAKYYQLILFVCLHICFRSKNIFPNRDVIKYSLCIDSIFIQESSKFLKL